MRKRVVFSLVLIAILGCAGGECPDQCQVVKMQSQVMPAYVSNENYGVFDTVYTRIEIKCFVSVYNAKTQDKIREDGKWVPYVYQPPRFVLDSTKGAVYDVTDSIKRNKQLTTQEVTQ